MSTALSTQVLVLNKSYTAHGFIPAREAFIKLILGKAEAVDIEPDKRFSSYDFSNWQDLSEYKSEFESENYRWIKVIGGQIAVPAIVRLLGYNEFRKMVVKLNRRNIYARDSNTCQYCGKRFKTEDLTLDHVLPSSRNGINSWANLVAACVKCNTRKANRTPVEAGMPLIKEPVKPSKASMFKLPEHRHWSWKHFVDAAYWNVELK